MKKITTLALSYLLLTACATNYHYQSENKPQLWIGQNISAVHKQWGTADQVLHTRTGETYWVYSATSGANFFNATSTNFSVLETNSDFPMNGKYGLQCSAIFKTNKNNIIISTSHQGSNCGGEWAPGG